MRLSIGAHVARVIALVERVALLAITREIPFVWNVLILANSTTHLQWLPLQQVSSNKRSRQTAELVQVRSPALTLSLSLSLSLFFFFWS